MKTIHFSYIAVFLFFGAVFMGKLPSYIQKSSVQGEKIQRVFNHKLEKVERILEELDMSVAKNNSNVALDGGVNGISFAVYKDSHLVFWSDKDAPFLQVDFDTISNGTVIAIVNSYYCVLKQQKDDFLKVGLIRLANNYPYENKFLVNGLHPDFSQYPASITLDASKGDYAIYNREGEYAFSIISDVAEINGASYIDVFAAIFFILGFIYLLISIRHLLLNQLNNKIKVALPILIAVVLLIRLFLVKTGVLSEVFHLFSPYIYATPIAPSFGDLILNTIVFVFLSYLIYRFLKIPAKNLKYKSNRNAWKGILNVCLVLALCYIQRVNHSLIVDSSLSIAVHNISEISVATIVSYLIFSLNFFGFFLIVLWVVRSLEEVKNYNLLIHFGASLLIFYLISFPLNLETDIYTILFSFALYLLILLMKDRLFGKAIFSSLVLILLMFSFYTLLFTVHFSKVKERVSSRAIAESLANEHDPIAEYFFEAFVAKINKDSLLHKRLVSDDYDILDVYNHIVNSYFYGYLKKYNLRIAVCGPPDSVLFDLPDYQWYHCYNYYNNMIQEYGVKVPSVPFYHLENLSGTISYLGWLKFDDPLTNEVSLFLELDSKLSLTNQPLGYPELLLDKRAINKYQTEYLSYAKYFKGKLASHNGKYDYSLSSEIFKRQTSKEFYSLKMDRYEHLIYYPDKENLVVVSRHIEKPIDYVVIFSYIFVFYYLASLLASFILLSRYRQLSFRNSLRNRIQFSIISILMTSLIFIAGGTIWFNVRKFNQTQLRVIQEKIQSVYVELEHNLTYENKLTSDWSTEKYENLDQLLIQFSDVFYSDINLYTPEGSLMATSRAEVFQLGLQNLKMDPVAYYKLSKEKLAKYVHQEHINKLDYLSAYVPFVNNKGKLLAYLNLPYFTKQKELKEDISTLTVAIMNIYMLLILLTIIIAVFISNQITKPLEILQARFRNLTLGARYDQIDYTRKDEIGQLVEEYNRMVKELERNVDLLAKSERESAWREMAKQVAHEIKNPLTPMRLSVQHLQRAWGDKKENFEVYLNRVSQTLIEQIDTLSTIASEFSNFAKMPVTHLEKVDLTLALQKTVTLFKGNEQVAVSLRVVEDDLCVNADKEQLNRAFINIIKNGIQAIPNDMQGEISVKLFRQGDMAQIEIQDNGKGIPENIREKLFMPSFTTKSSGMGIGLSIVQNTVELIGGSIQFDTELGRGTTFKITLPLYDDPT